MKPYEYGAPSDQTAVDDTLRIIGAHNLHEGDLVDAMLALRTQEQHESRGGLLLSREDMPGMVTQLLNGSVTNPRVRHLLESIGVPQTAMDLETRKKMTTHQ